MYGRLRSEDAGALQVLERVKDPLQTLVSRDQYETAYAVLAHFLLIAQRAPILFSQVEPFGPHCLRLRTALPAFNDSACAAVLLVHVLL